MVGLPKGLVCVLLLASSALLGSANIVDTIELPTGDFSVTTVDSNKNSGLATQMEDGGADQGYIRYQSTADKVGMHLAQAASFIAKYNSTAAFALQEAVGTVATKEASFSGQTLYTKILTPYLQYWNGRLMTKPNPFNVYLIFYGTWSLSQKVVVRDFVNSLGYRYKYKGSPSLKGWWDIVVRYYHDKHGASVTPNVLLKGEINDPYSRKPYGSSLNPLTPAALWKIVKRSLNPRLKGHFPVDPNGAYVILTSKDVYTSGFCSFFCAYHTSNVFNGQRLAYVFAGNPEIQCPLTCTYKYLDPFYKPPNGDLGLDAVVDKIGHELSEVVTNPFDARGSNPGWVVAKSLIECADLCEWNYGVPNYERNGIVWNVRGVNNRRFLIQTNFNRRLKACAMQGDNTIPNSS